MPKHPKKSLTEATGGHRAAKSLTAQAASGFLWTIVQTLGSKAVGMLGQIILARLLLPRDFGLVALSIIAVSFASVIRQTGIQQILIQRHKHFRRWANPAFWLELGMGSATAAILALASPIAAAVFHSHSLIGLILVSAAAAPLSAWMVLPTARLMIDMRFKAIAIVGIACNSAATVMSVLFAWRGFGAYSFLLPLPIATGIRCFWLWRLARPRVNLDPQFRRWRLLIGDSGLMIATGFLNSVMYQAGYLALGLLYPKAAVGQFFFALNLSAQMALLLSQNLGGVLLPALAKMQDDSARHAAALIKALRMLAFISTPACLLLIIVAKPLVAIVYGTKWLPAVPMLQIMAAAAAISIPSSPAATAMQSQGRFSVLFRWTAIQTPLFLATVFSGAWWGGGIGVAVAWFLFVLATSPITIRLGAEDGITWREIMGIYAGPLAAGLVTVATVCAISILWPEVIQHYLLWWGTAAAVTALAYPPAGRILCRPEFEQAKRYAVAALAMLRRTSGGGGHDEVSMR